jgi:hypothetical protein
MRELMVTQIVAAMVGTIRTDKDYTRLAKQAQDNEFACLRQYLAFEANKQVDAIMDLCEHNFEQKVLNAMGTNRCYTKTLYNQVSGKAEGYSLNKFRDVMYSLERKGKIEKKEDHPNYPYWVRVKISPFIKNKEAYSKDSNHG